MSEQHSFSARWHKFKEQDFSANIFRASRWTVYFIAIGIIAGLGSIVFHYLTQLGVHYFLDAIAGYRPPAPAGEHHLITPTTREFNRWLLLLLPALGGLVSGVLVYTLAPEAEGHGTDAAINAYHNAGGYIRARVPIVKTIASAITLTSGGSGGREGPIAQIGAGFGSFLATKLKLSNRERRIMMAAGVGAGVGSIFRAPLAGALFAAEVLYRDPEFESDVIIPAGISSVVAYCIFCLVFGWGSLFESPDFVFRNPLELAPYLVLALVLVAVGAMYVKVFYGVIEVFHNLRVPNHIKPAIGGLLTGMIGFFLPHTLAFGYGFAQKALDNELTIAFLLTLAFGKILTTSFSIGSGGSGGVFGPSIVIGGALGGVVGQVFHRLAPQVVTEPGAFVIVGMAGFFTSVSNTPISTIIFVSEMTNSYHLLLPSLLVCSVAYLAAKRWTIFHCQPESRLDSPAHAGKFFVDVLQTIKVGDLADKIRPVTRIPQNMLFSDFKKTFAETVQHYFPVMDSDQKLIGIFSINDVRSVLFSTEIEPLVVMKDIGTTDIIVTTPSEDLNAVMKKFTIRNIDSLPVVQEDDHRELIGMLSRREVIAFYNEQLARRKAAGDEGKTAGDAGGESAE
jgi:CIC family chloride channel protein